MEVERSTTRPSEPNPKRKISVPPYRYKALKKSWLSIYTPIEEKMKINIRMNLKTRKVELKTIIDTPDASNLQKCVDFVHAFMLGFDIVDVSLVLCYDEFYVAIKDVRKLKGERLSRAIDKLCGDEGKAKSAIENVTKTRIVIDNLKIHILGSHKNIKGARDHLCSLLLGSPNKGKLHSKL